MNKLICFSFALASLAVFANGIFFDPISLTVGTVGATAGAAALTSAGALAAGVGLVGAGVVVGALAARAGRGGGFGGFRRRGRRSSGEGDELEILDTETLAALQLVDSYFMTILDVDVDDCGKKLVCEIQTVPAANRTAEETLIANLFDDSTTIDPLSAKAEYDLASFIGANYDKVVCARRYHRCELNRKTIVQGLSKLGKSE